MNDADWREGNAAAECSDGDSHSPQAGPIAATAEMDWRAGPSLDGMGRGNSLSDALGRQEQGRDSQGFESFGPGNRRQVRPSRSLWTPERTQIAISMFDTGKNCVEIGQRIGCSPQYVSKHLVSHGRRYVSTSVWTEERTQRAAEMWVRGVNGTTIAAELGNGVTRNAVIGKLSRMGIATPVAPGGSGVRKTRSKAPGKTRVRNSLPRTALPKSKPMPLEPLNIAFMQRTPFQCAEVVGHDGLALFCGHPIYRLSNCAWHFRINRERRT